MSFDTGIIKNELTFNKIGDYTYNADIDDNKFIDLLTGILDSFTLNGNGTFSPIMDIGLSEELISRLIADAFIYKHKDLVVNTSDVIIINFNLAETLYKITVANNSEKLGGIVYGIIT